MRPQEKAYLELIEQVIEDFGRIQRDFVLDKNGIRAIVRFIEDFSGSPPRFALDDPVVVKGRKAAERVIAELERELASLQEVRPPAEWEQFHQSLVRSLELQLQGYREMSRVFQDSDTAHLRAGRELVDRGMGLLQSGQRQSS
ncbi:MAG TPA: hypothetical protein VNO81_06680 [Candidatus Nitrosotenuis sp.]|nr:hypothetical protein [Candidatus Nitrosotenuis sp.]